MTVVHLSNQQKLLHVYAGTLVYKKYADTKIELYVFFKIFLILFHKRFLRNIFQVVLVLCHGKISFAVQFFYSILCQILTIHGKTKWLWSLIIKQICFGISLSIQQHNKDFCYWQSWRTSKVLPFYEQLYNNRFLIMLYEMKYS